MSAKLSNTSVLPQPRFGLLTRLLVAARLLAVETLPMKGATHS